MKSSVSGNERSWAIELISEINNYLKPLDFTIKKAGGESTLNTGSKRMFPDLLLFGDKEQRLVLQGWELKMPDVSINDPEFIADAQRKADALGLNSCVLWNFTCAVLYVKNERGNFELRCKWTDTDYIKTRIDVQRYKKEWTCLLHKVIDELNRFFNNKELKTTSIDAIVSKSIISTIIQTHKNAVAEHLKRKAVSDSKIGAYIDLWWKSISCEYKYGETDSYTAYAKSIILNWMNRILFAHLIKDYQNKAACIDELDYGFTVSKANQLFMQISERCDFLNIFAPVEYNENLPELTWTAFLDFSNFLKKNNISKCNQDLFHQILEDTVDTVKREINGQYTTPSVLAEILVRLTVQDWTKNFLDCCCGTGTIPTEALTIKKEKIGAEKAAETVWASDKYEYPLQIANTAMVNYDMIKLPCRLFKSNALELSVGKKVNIIDPVTGNNLKISLPQFYSIAVNMPFITFENISDEDNRIIHNYFTKEELSGRSDLYIYITLKLADLLTPGGKLGMITSNSWLASDSGRKFLSQLKQKYRILQVHLSDQGRWFQQAKIVAVITILQKKENESKESGTTFFLWKKSLGELQDTLIKDDLINSSLLNKEAEGITSARYYTQSELSEYEKTELSFSVLFHNAEPIFDILKKSIRIDEIFNVIRGARRGWDPLFYPRNRHSIEDIYLQDCLLNSKGISGYEIQASDKAFCCSKSIKELKEEKHTGALNWILTFEDQKNGTGKPLTEVLKTSSLKWYEMPANETADIVTSINPEKRFFFAKFKSPTFINQRLIGLRYSNQSSTNKDLCFALLNSVFTLFSIEAAGFGRGDGVLDLSKNNLARCRILDPGKLSNTAAQRIVKAFEPIKKRGFYDIHEELERKDRKDFEKTVFKEFNLDGSFEKIKNLFLSMVNTRLTAKKS